MGFRRPSIVKGTFEFNAVDQEPRGFTSVGVLVTDSYLTDSGEIIDVVGFDVRGWEIRDVPFENINFRHLAGDELTRSDLG